MKRIFAFMISIVILTMCINTPPFIIPAGAETPIDLTRDLNGDGEVNQKDMTLLSRYIAGWIGTTLTDESADIDADSYVNFKDLTHLSRLIAGWDIDPDFSVNNPLYTWPDISPIDSKAGTTFLSAKDVPAATSPLSKFLLTTQDNPSFPFNVACNISGTTVTALIPAGIKLNAMKAEFTFTGQKLMQGNNQVYSNLTSFNFTKPITLTLIGNTGSVTTYTVYVMTLKTGLPSFSIATTNYEDIDSKFDSINCSVYTGGGNKDTCYYAGSAPVLATGTIKGRGNSSWYSFPKKSYTLKFDSKQELFGMPANKEWVLSANYADRTLVRNAVAFQLANYVEMETVMEVRFVDLWVNGVYAGSYQLIEKIEIGKNRINIADFDPALEPDQVGYVIETNGHNNVTPRPSYWQTYGPYATYDSNSGDIFFKSLHYSSLFTVKKPSDTKLTALPQAVGETYIAYIYDYMDKLEAAIKSRSYSAASQYLDMEAMAKWYLVEETTMNTDSKLFCSCFMYKDVGGKMKMGPVWDFDLGIGNGKYGWSTSSTYLDGSTWFKDLLAMPEFKATVKNIWNSSKTNSQNIFSFIDQTSTMLHTSQAINFQKWTMANYPKYTSSYVYDGVYAFETYEEQVNYMKNFLSARFTYMNNKINSW